MTALWQKVKDKELYYITTIADAEKLAGALSAVQVGVYNVTFEPGCGTTGTSTMLQRATAVDVAKELADIILLEKDLMVLEQGIIEGRKIFANLIKYIKMTACSNFGNMFSVPTASALLPFLPMVSVHLIFLNLIYDLSCTAIPWDNVDEEFIARSRKWDASSMGSFMIRIALPAPSWRGTGLCGTACGLLCIPDPLHPAVHGAGHQPEKKPTSTHYGELL